MDLLTLDFDSLQPTDIFERYTSLIWTERFGTYGEFQLTSSQVEDTISALPLGSFITLRDTHEVMVVETHSVEPNQADGTPEIKISGRSLDSFFENRVLIPKTYGESWNLLQSYTPQQMLALLMWNAICNDTGQDPTKDPDDPPYPQQVDPNLSHPKVAISLGPVKSQSPINWSLSADTVSKQLTTIQQAYQLGIRTIRPTVTETIYSEISFDTSIESVTRGLPIIEYDISDNTMLRFDIYQGIDRTVDQSIVKPVIFSVSSGHVVKPKYLKSIKNAKNQGVVISDWGTFIFPEDLALDGFLRKSLLIDGENREFQQLVAYSALELQKSQVLAMADGEIGSHSPYTYGVDYFLGDTITFAGSYESDTAMFVNEIVRTSDINGETISPGIMNYSDLQYYDGGGHAG